MRWGRVGDGNGADAFPSSSKPRFGIDPMEMTEMEEADR